MLFDWRRKVVWRAAAGGRETRTACIAATATVSSSVGNASAFLPKRIIIIRRAHLYTPKRSEIITIMVFRRTRP